MRALIQQTSSGLYWKAGERGYEPTSQELIDQSRATKERSQSFKERVKAALAGVIQTVAAIKERKKQTKFERNKVADGDS